jgi:hypothetical protein
MFLIFIKIKQQNQAPDWLIILPIVLTQAGAFAYSAK